MVTAIAATYSEPWAKVRTSDGITQPFQILAGVLQGDTLALFLFIFTLDYVLRLAIIGREEEMGFTLTKSASQRIPAKMLADLDFADDTSLLFNTVEKTCKLLGGVEQQYSWVSLGVNAKETKIMPINAKETVRVNTRDSNLWKLSMISTT